MQYKERGAVTKRNSIVFFWLRPRPLAISPLLLTQGFVLRTVAASVNTRFDVSLVSRRLCNPNIENRPK